MAAPPPPPQGSGNDNVQGSDGNDDLNGFEGNDTVYGNDGSDQVRGGKGNDTVYGGKSNDYVYGDNGDDLLSGDHGDDFVDGGDGHDTASFSGSIHDYTIKQEGGGFRITDKRGDQDGSDFVTNVENFSFGGQSFSADSLIQAAAPVVVQPMVIAPPPPPVVVAPPTPPAEPVVVAPPPPVVVAPPVADPVAPPPPVVVAPPAADPVAPPPPPVVVAPPVTVFNPATAAEVATTIEAFLQTLVVAPPADPVAVTADAASAEIVAPKPPEPVSLPVEPSILNSPAMALAYIASYGDLIKAYGADAAMGVIHYLLHGQGEKRVISFDPAAYMAANPDVAKAVNGDTVEATKHYINFGFNEGRLTAPAPGSPPPPVVAEPKPPSKPWVYSSANMAIINYVAAFKGAIQQSMESNAIISRDIAKAIMAGMVDVNITRASMPRRSAEDDLNLRASLIATQQNARALESKN